MLTVLRALALGLLAWMAARAVSVLFSPRGTRGPGRREDASRAARGEPERLVRDPVCHVRIPEGRAIVARIGGRDVHFCSETCREAYRGTSPGPD